MQVELAGAGGEGACAALARVDGVGEIELEGRTLRARASDGAAAIPLVLAALERDGVAVTAVTLARPSLDDVYLRHAGRAFQRAEREHGALAEVAA